MAAGKSPPKQIILKHRRAKDYRTVVAEGILVSDVNDKILVTVFDDVLDHEETFQLATNDNKPRYALAENGIKSTGVREDRVGLLMTYETSIKLAALLLNTLKQQGVEMPGIRFEEAEQSAKNSGA